PVPVSVVPGTGRFTLRPDSAIYADAAAAPVAEYLAEVLGAMTGHPTAVGPAASAPPPGSVVLAAGAADAQLGSEGHALSVTDTALTLSAPAPAGLMRGVQTLRQLLAPGVDGWTVPRGQIRDYPRFPYRGVMLDVARHFFPVPAVRRLIDLAALHKLN